MAENVRLTDEKRDNLKVIVVNGSYILQKYNNDNCKDILIKDAPKSINPGVYRLREAKNPVDKVYTNSSVIYSDEKVAITENKKRLLKHNNEHLKLKLGEVVNLDYTIDNELPKKQVLDNKSIKTKSRSR